MSDKRILLDTASYMDSPEAAALDDVPREDARRIVQRFIAASYEDSGKAPRYLDGPEVEQILCAHLPRRFAERDPLAAQTERVLEGFLRYLDANEVVFTSFEQMQALANCAGAFRDLVSSGAAHRDGMVVGKGRTIRHQADKVGRNDPCPCGSGRKFKKCCMRLGDGDS